MQYFYLYSVFFLACNILILHVIRFCRRNFSLEKKKKRENKKQYKPLRGSQFLRVAAHVQPLTREPEEPWYEIVLLEELRPWNESAAVVEGHLFEKALFSVNKMLVLTDSGRREWEVEETDSKTRCFWGELRWNPPPLLETRCHLKAALNHDFLVITFRFGV